MLKSRTKLIDSDENLSLTNSGTRALLIDLDNCPKQIDELPEALACFKRAIVCYGGVGPKVHVSVVSLPAATINEGKLEIEVKT